MSVEHPTESQAARAGRAGGLARVANARRRKALAAGAVRDPDCLTCWAVAELTGGRLAVCRWCRGETAAVERSEEE
jgi:hypothetical protein